MFDIIVHDAWVICMSIIVHISFIIIGMKWHIALHMEGDIA